MIKEKLLIVEDEREWVENYKILLENEDWDFVDVPTAELAIDTLKRTYYSVVILDLSLHPSFQFDRTSDKVQEYLVSKHEGTKHIIISGAADKLDVKKGAYVYKAFATFFKELFDEVAFMMAVREAFNINKKERPDFVKEAYELFIGADERVIFEHKILTGIKPEGGISGWYSFQEKFFKTISPLLPHQTRREIVWQGKFILGLFWSRQIGKAISICISRVDVTDKECINIINEWLGWQHSDFAKVISKGLQGCYFIEPDLAFADFTS